MQSTSSVAARACAAASCLTRWHMENTCPGCSPKTQECTGERTHEAPPLVGTCREAGCDCVEWFQQAALLLAGQEPGWRSPLLPKDKYPANAQGIQAFREVMPVDFLAVMDDPKYHMLKTPIDYSYSGGQSGCGIPSATCGPAEPSTSTAAAAAAAAAGKPLPPPPPPPPPSPPSAPPPASYAVKMAVTIEGDVTTFTPEVLTPIRQKVATEAAVPLDAVEATATAGSVKIDFTVNMQSEAAADTALTAITAKLTDTATAGTFLSTPGADPVTVEAIVTPTKVVLVSPPPPPAAPPPASPPKKDEAGLPLAAIIGAAAGGAVLLCGVVGLVIFVRSRGGNKAVAPSS